MTLYRNNNLIIRTKPLNKLLNKNRIFISIPQELKLKTDLVQLMFYTFLNL